MGHCKSDTKEKQCWNIKTLIILSNTKEETGKYITEINSEDRKRTRGNSLPFREPTLGKLERRG